MKVLVIDNYDSFTYNLVQLVKECSEYPVDVWRNDEFTLPQVQDYNKIILSPGPGLPSEAGLMPTLVKEYSTSKQILGICLGHQCIGEIFGASLENLTDVVHGKGLLTRIEDRDNYIFKDLDSEFETGRYHSWVVSNKNFPDCLKVTAVDVENNIMGLKHAEYDVQGLQFHPESVLTKTGRQILTNWLVK